MTASADPKVTAMLPTSAASRVDSATRLVMDGFVGQQPMFKKHKVLPHPRRGSHGPVRNRNRAGTEDRRRATAPRKYDLAVDTSLVEDSGSQPSSPSLRHTTRRIGGEPPPTPPGHSRNSLSSQSHIPSSPTYVASPLQSLEDIQAQPPATPTNQQSPPTPNLTPDRTPPGPAERRPKPRPSVHDRLPSKMTVDSRTESFKTAPENPYSSEEDDGKSTLRPVLSSAKTSQSTVRQSNGDTKSRPPVVGLGLGLEATLEDNLTPQTRGEFRAFDGEWVMNDTEVEQEWDDNLRRNVTVRKRRPRPQNNGHVGEVIEHVIVAPTNATKTLRSLSLQETPLVHPSGRVVSDRLQTNKAPSTSESSISMDLRRSSVMSTRSTASTVVSAILVETAPLRRKTLRHVRKQPALRDSGEDLSPSSSAPTSIALEDMQRQRPSNANARPRDATRTSQTSTSTVNSLASRKARREVWKTGGIPVVVIPDRQSSVRSSSKEPSLRSTSSRRSRRTQSLGSAPLSRSKELVAQPERLSRWSKNLSGSDGSLPGDQRTMDYPPVIPARSSSLSAPTSRNPSRTGSLTADSLKAHNAFQVQHSQQTLQRANEKLQNLQRNGSSQDQHNGHATKSKQKATERTHLDPHYANGIRDARLPSVDSHKAGKEGLEPNGRVPSVDHDGDPFFGKRLSVQNTPLSQASMETSGTSHASHAEVSEAMAVNIYPHQNKSVMMVNHSSKPSESSSTDQRMPPSESDTPVFKMIQSETISPVTPPQPMFSMDDVDSPLRNPRDPPPPPAINFIPATPSGLTPTVEKDKQLGNFYETVEETPSRSMSLLRRAFSRRRGRPQYGPSSSRTPGLITRTFSLSRSSRRDSNGPSIKGKGPALRRSRTLDDAPADDSKLHPFWRPAYSDYEDDEDDGDYDESYDRTFKYPPVDNRPMLPRRSLSARMKRTFAILPIRDDLYEDDDHFYRKRRHEEPTARRTIRRTPSGNLRVMKHRHSLESLPHSPRAAKAIGGREANSKRPLTAPEDASASAGDYSRVSFRQSGRFGRSASVSSARDGPGPGAAEGGRRSSSGSVLADLGSRINLARRMSEHRREKRSRELRQMISGPREVRDGVVDVIRPGNQFRDETFTRPREQPAPQQPQFRSYPVL